MVNQLTIFGCLILSKKHKKVFTFYVIYGVIIFILYRKECSKLQNQLFSDSICCYLQNVESDVKQKITEDSIVLQANNRGTLSNVAEILSAKDLIVCYSSVDDNQIEIKV